LDVWLAPAGEEDKDQREEELLAVLRVHPDELDAESLHGPIRVHFSEHVIHG